MNTNAKRLWKNEFFQTILVAVLVVLAVFSFWYGSESILHTKSLPFYIVSSGSMCIPYDASCDGWTHPFDRTLHVGDLIVIQGVDPKTLNSNYPNSDIIVFDDPNNPNGVPIVHRITSEIFQNGTIYFFTKGDGNPPVTWPNQVEKYAPDGGWYNPNYYSDHPNIPRGSVPQEYVLGRVVLRIPWLGWVTIYTEQFQGWLAVHGLNVGVPLIIVFVALIVIIEFILPMLRGRKKLAKTKIGITQ